MLPPNSGKGCWTCKQRKVACDRQRPWCRACSSSGRPCLGYGVKLSWPREGDTKRAIVLQSDARFLYSRIQGQFVVPHPSKGVEEEATSAEYEFINVSSFDMEIYIELSKTGSFGRMPQHRENPPIRHNPRWPPFPSDATEINLLAYYEEKVAPRLTAADSAAVQNLVFRMCFSDLQPASIGLLFAVYAIASLHYADSRSALVFKSKANAYISASARQSPNATLSMQQIMGCMMLSMFETAALTYPDYDWQHDICCLRLTGKATFALDRVYEGDDALVLEMVTYHDFLAKFSTRHYTRRTDIMVENVQSKHFETVALNSSHQTFIRPTLGCSLKVFCILTSILDTCWETERDSGLQMETLDSLERRLKFAPQEIDELYCTNQTPVDFAHTTSIAELHRLSGLIYLYRVGREVHYSHQTLQSLVSDAFGILETVHTCERTFPLFILACEARTDPQRAIILKISRRTEEEYFSTVMVRMREYIEKFWALADLDVADEMGHAEKMNAAVSAQSLPSFL